MIPPPVDFGPTASLATLKARSRLLQSIRAFFYTHGFIEVDTPHISHDIVVDAWLEPFTTRFVPEGESSAGCRSEKTAKKQSETEPNSLNPSNELFLQTSPEFCMKRLLASGAEAIFQLGHVFRNGEVGANHNPEFLMLEWYQLGSTYHDQMTVTEQLLRELAAETLALSHLQSAKKPRRNKPATLASTECSTTSLIDHFTAGHIDYLSHIITGPGFERLTYDEAFQRHAGFRPSEKTTAEFPDLARKRGEVPPPGLADDDRDGWLNFLLATCVEPHLGQERPQFVYDYPASQAALSRVRPEKDRESAVAERFELYVRGIEMCNGYQELTDAVELQHRMTIQNLLRVRAGRRPLPMKNRLLEAMQAGLPECSGVAMGIDRLLMFLLAKSKLVEVIPFPWANA